jgi:hypothetical protein
MQLPITCGTEETTLNLADYNGTDFVTNGKTVDLTKQF